MKPSQNRKDRYEPSNFYCKRVQLIFLLRALVGWHTRNRISNWNSYSLHNLRINEIPIGIVILILKIYLTNRELVSIYKAIWKRFIQLQSSKANCNYLAFQQSLKNRKFSKHFSFLQEAKKNSSNFMFLQFALAVQQIGNQSHASQQQSIWDSG